MTGLEQAGAQAAGGTLIVCILTSHTPQYALCKESTGPHAAAVYGSQERNGFKRSLTFIFRKILTFDCRHRGCSYSPQITQVSPHQKFPASPSFKLTANPTLWCSPAR
ncbi:hypothetical protein GYMLUDRAFT_399359 [Collybiopsis luxurians FD-317 M1]|nr:hypothetical protein GYMLUDRAFT_399359 [Collybiopsis luxurians FD-317 M1]